MEQNKRLSQRKDHPAIDLVLRLLCIEGFDLGDQPLNFLLDVER